MLSAIDRFLLEHLHITAADVDSSAAYRLALEALECTTTQDIAGLADLSAQKIVDMAPAAGIPIVRARRLASGARQLLRAMQPASITPARARDEANEEMRQLTVEVTPADDQVLRVSGKVAMEGASMRMLPVCFSHICIHDRVQWLPKAETIRWTKCSPDFGFSNPAQLKPLKCPVAVLDNGTGLVKAGFAGDQLPRLTFPCAVGRPSKRHGAASQKHAVLGWEALESPGVEVSYPMSNGVVRDFGDMMMVWDATWSQLGVDPKETRLLMTDPALNPTANKQRTIEIMLEHYGFAGVSMQVQAVLTLYAHGLTTGVVLDSGDGVSHAVSVVDGYALPHLTQRLELAGRHVTEHLMELLIRRGACLHRQHDLDSVRRIKEACCYVALDPARELKFARETTCLTKSYTLPDGRVITLGPERFQAPELLFRPSLVDKEQAGIAHMVFNAIHEADMDNRRALYEKIVISGGNTMLPGLSTRLELELSRLYTNVVLQGDTSRMKQLKLRVHDNTDRQFMVFRGAAVMAQMLQHDRPDHWLTAAEWQEDPHRAMVRMGIVPAS